MSIVQPYQLFHFHIIQQQYHFRFKKVLIFLKNKRLGIFNEKTFFRTNIIVTRIYYSFHSAMKVNFKFSWSITVYLFKGNLKAECVEWVWDEFKLFSNRKTFILFVKKISPFSRNKNFYNFTFFYILR